MNEPSPLDSRLAALDILDAVVRRHRPLDTALAESRGFGELTDRDRAFARNLVSTTLRRHGQIDALVQPCLEKPLARKASRIELILKMGAAQLFFTDVADHAAVTTAVDLTRAIDLHGYAKLVNAVLRRLTREGTERVATQDAERLNTPGWLWDSWTTAYGPDTCRRIARAHLSEPPLDISVKGDSGKWAERLQAEEMENGTLRRRTGGSVTGLPGFSEGEWWVQDAAARSVAALLGDVRGKSVIDLCAAPGGKTAYLANAGAAVTAVDRSPARVERLKENLARLRLTAATVTADALDWRPRQPADLVLLDAPCSATGTIRRHPDLIFNKSYADVARLACLQAKLIWAAQDMVMSGGSLIFATCSLQPEEGHDHFSVTHETERPKNEGVSVSPFLANEAAGFVECLDTNGAFRSLPCHLASRGGLDGFYACRLLRH